LPRARYASIFRDTSEAVKRAEGVATARIRILVSKGAVPPTQPEDALHIAIAVANGIEYLVTWNFKHIANATTRSRIHAVCTAEGYDPSTICTPEELLEPDADV